MLKNIWVDGSIREFSKCCFYFCFGVEAWGGYRGDYIGGYGGASGAWAGLSGVCISAGLEIEFRLRHVPAIREFEMFIFYKDEQIATRRVDFFVDATSLWKMKAVSELTNDHLAQALNYLEAYNVEIGMLLNFGAPSLQFKRLYNKRYRPEIMNQGPGTYPH